MSKIEFSWENSTYLLGKINALISGHPGGLTPGTHGGIVRDFKPSFGPGRGHWTAFALLRQETRGKTPGICNIAAILKMKDNQGSQTENETNENVSCFCEKEERRYAITLPCQLLSYQLPIIAIFFPQTKTNLFFTDLWSCVRNEAKHAWSGTMDPAWRFRKQNQRVLPLGGSGSGFLIQDRSDHGVPKERNFGS